MRAACDDNMYSVQCSVLYTVQWPVYGLHGAGPVGAGMSRET